jgi:Ca-activated chloride channel family protein
VVKSLDAILLISLGVLVLAAAAEWLHARRCARVERLAFGAAGPRRWTRFVGAIRAASVALLAWSVLVLWSIDGASADSHKAKPPTHHLVIALDVSPSMYIKDAAGGKKSRQHRAAEVVMSVLDRLDMASTRVSIVAFYSAARPVVIDTLDLAIVQNVLGELPLGHAFKAGQTDMYSGIAAAAEIGKTWKPRSSTLLVVSDGDTIPEKAPVALPPAFSDVLVVGIGDPIRASPIADRVSRQDSASLKRLAARLRGDYYDANASHLPTRTLRGLKMLGLREERPTPLRTIALWCAGLSAVALAGLTPLLVFAGTRRAAVARTATVTASTVSTRPRAATVAEGAAV